MVSLHQEKKALLACIKSRYDWVVEVEHIVDGSWARQPQEISNAEVERRLDAPFPRLSCFLEAEERTEEEKVRLGHLLKVFTHLRPGLVHCYDLEGFPRTNNDGEASLSARLARVASASWRQVRQETRASRSANSSIALVFAISHRLL
jgi:hypothetical protein